MPASRSMSEVLLRQMAMLKMLPRYPRRIATSELKERLAELGFETTFRTIQRDLQTLATFFEIECHDETKPYGWRWRQEAPLFEVPSMDPKTAVALKLSAAFLARVLPYETFRRLDPHVRQAEKVLQGLSNSKLASWPNKIRVTSAGLPLIYPTVPSEILDVVTRALLEDRRFKCTYRTRRGVVRDYEVHPLGLVYRDALAYLVCTLDAEERVVTIAPHRMRAADLLAGPRRAPDRFDLDAFVNAGGTGFLLGDPVDLVMLVHASALPSIVELPIDAAQTVERYDDHRSLVRARAPNSLELHRWLLGLGDAIEVLEPDGLRDRIAKIHKTAAARYEGTARRSWELPHALEHRVLDSK